MRQTALARHLPDSLGQTHGEDGGGVSARVPGVWRRHPTDLAHHRTRAHPQDPHALGRTTRTASGVTCPRPAHRLGRARASPLSTGHPSKLHPTTCPRSTSTASERRRTRPAHVGKLRTRTRSAQTPEKRHQSGCGASRETRSGRPGRSSRGSRVAHQPEDRRGSAIETRIPFERQVPTSGIIPFRCSRSRRGHGILPARSLPHGPDPETWPR
jgi:hypothetical protein